MLTHPLPIAGKSPIKNLAGRQLPTTATSTYLLVVHVIIGRLSIGHDLPEEYTKAPDIAADCELSSEDSLWGSPPNRDFPTLRNQYYNNNNLRLNG